MASDLATPSTAPQIIHELVAKFTEHRDSYNRGDYNETQLRRDFLDPFFKAMGWDIDNQKGYAEKFREVIHEDAIRVEASVKAPDYCFRVGGQRMFFVEAKKPSVNIKDDIAPAFQLRRYAWTAKLPLSILTDFEELAVYDCRIKPDKNDKASVGRVLLLKYTDFVDRWHELADIFSFDAINRGAFDKYAESNKKKRGTAEVDEAFLEEIEQWRESLAKNLSLRNKDQDLSERELNTAVQLITLQRQLFAKERALPDLANNIKCGNSLIGPDFYTGRQGELFDEEETLRINAFDWKRRFAPIFENDDPGFDAVIGNPPYIQQSMAAYYNEDVSEYYSKRFSSSMGRQNTFGLFIENILRYLLAHKGHLSFIVPNTILTQEYYQGLRKQILKTRIVNLTTFTQPVFKDAVVETIVFVLQNSSPGKNSVSVVSWDNKNWVLKSKRLRQDNYQNTHANAFQVNVDDELISLQKKLNASATLLGQVANINQAIALKEDRSASIFDAPAGPNFKKVIDGRNIGRYKLYWGGEYLAYDVTKIHSCKRTDIFDASEKIFFRRVGERLIATIDDEQYYALNTLVVITWNSKTDIKLKFLLGMINSTLANYYYVTYLKSTKKVFSEIQAR